MEVEFAPNELLEPILAKIKHDTGLGAIYWYEVVYYYDGCWRSYGNGETFEDGKEVVKWKYVKNCM